MLEINDNLAIPEEEIEKRFSTSGGPGGQNVNKVATRVELRFNLETTTALPRWVVDRVRARERGRITRDGVLRIVCQVHREQGRNVAEARERLVEVIRSAMKRPRRRVPTRPTTASRTRRLGEKRRRGKVKRLRGRVKDDE